MTAVEEISGLMVQLDALTYQIKAKLQSSLTPEQVDQIKATLAIIATNLNQMAQ